MKVLRAWVCAAALVGQAAFAQVVITSLDLGGNLTWTNSTTNATYRVEWAGSAEGPWQGFDALTNLLSIRAATNVLRVQVPRFYRIVWTDPPPPDPVGEFAYRLYDNDWSLLYTGRWVLYWTNSVHERRLAGTWETAGVAAGYDHYKESGQVTGVTNGFKLYLWTLDRFDDNWHFNGTLYAPTYSGTWEWITFGDRQWGQFRAEKLTTNP